MTNKPIAALAFVLLAAVSSFAQSASASAELKALLNRFLDGAGRSDAGVHERFWANDLVYTRSNGTRINKAELMKSVRSAPTAKPGASATVYSAEDIRIQQYGNTAIVAFRLVATSPGSQGTKEVSSFLNTGTFVRRGRVWRVVAWQSTAVPKAPNAFVPTDRAVKEPGKAYIKGPRGGCYYLSAGNRKTYVSKELCN